MSETEREQVQSHIEIPLPPPQLKHRVANLKLNSKFFGNKFDTDVNVTGELKELLESNQYVFVTPDGLMFEIKRNIGDYLMQDDDEDDDEQKIKTLETLLNTKDGGKRRKSKSRKSRKGLKKSRKSLRR
jgi:hypothetical protein